ncbi:MAG: hypothetical protein CL927_09940 [Deltaproteobacteria bacterium]|nr:hypothetical protein [Deltaproteobacteria bacterium]HCH62081.1 hypothetical protein [Deltaproteobacteria bacterium]
MSMLSSAFLLGALPALAAEVSVTERGHASNPTWSPDGARIAFEVNDYSGHISLFSTDVRNGNPMGAPAQANLPGAKSQFGGSGSIAANPSWAQGGMMFEGSSAGGTMRIYYWTPVGSAPSEILSSAQISGDLTWPATSQDQSKLAFVSDATGKGDIYVWDSSTNEVSRALDSPFSEAAPCFDQGGETIVFSRKNQGGEDLFTVASGAASPRIGGQGDQTRPIYAGDGSIVYFTSERGDGHWDIAVSTGQGKKKVIAKDVRLPVRASPALAGNGQWVAYGSDLSEKGKFIFFTKLDGSATVEIDTGLIAAGEPAITSANGRTFMAFTALPDVGADWRQLHIIDISGKGI